MRRKDKEIKNKNEIEDILSNNCICRIAFSYNKIPYIVPMNYGYKENKIYLHSAREGKKIDILKRNNNVCFEITDSIEIIKSKNACDFSTKFRSIIGLGKIRIISNQENKKEALNVIMYHHTKRKDWVFPDNMIEKVNIMEIEINSISGKKSFI
jgi:nitroimidazol reductase NimA-like FMN-containing flavoprotein (pyridoxamine 5'-phosphate oxidase superfamily)